MKKINQMVALVPICIVIVIILFFVFKGGNCNEIIKNDEYKEIIVSNWNGMEQRYVICNAKVDGGIDTNFSDCITTFYSDMERTEFVEQNKDYIGDVKYYDECLRHDASLFFNDDNYYVIYYDNNNNYYVVQNCYALYEISGSRIHIPFLVYLSINFGSFDVYKQDGKNMLDFLYDNYSFEDACEFYERISQDYIKIDREDKKIYVSGYDVYSHEIIKDCVILDFKNRVIVGENKNGDMITLDGK